MVRAVPPRRGFSGYSKPQHGGHAVERLTVTVRDLPFTVRNVESVRLGKLPFERVKTGYRLALPLKAADILLLRP